MSYQVIFQANIRQRELALVRLCYNVVSVKLHISELKHRHDQTNWLTCRGSEQAVGYDGGYKVAALAADANRYIQ